MAGKLLLYLSGCEVGRSDASNCDGALLHFRGIYALSFETRTGPDALMGNSLSQQSSKVENAGGWAPVKLQKESSKYHASSVR